MICNYSNTYLVYKTTKEDAFKRETVQFTIVYLLKVYYFLEKTKFHKTTLYKYKISLCLKVSYGPSEGALQTYMLASNFDP